MSTLWAWDPAGHPPQNSGRRPSGGRPERDWWYTQMAVWTKMEEWVVGGMLSELMLAALR